MIELKPTHPEVRKAVKTVVEAMEETGITCFATQDDDNPDLWSVQCAEKVPNKTDSYIIHTCFVGWNASAKALSFAGYDSGRTARNEKEGITGDDGLEMVDLKTLDMVALWLTGEFHRILRSAETKMMKMDEVAKKAAPAMAADIIASVTEGVRP